MKIFACILLLLIVIYLSYYKSFKNDIKILQVYLDNFKLDLLYEKYPIVVYDKVYDNDQLMKTIFAYSYCFSKKQKAIPSIPTINTSKYAILSSDTDTSVKIISPKYAGEAKQKKPLEHSNMQYVSINLQAKQVLILPYKWIYQSENFLYITQLDDPISCFLR